jgi:hypothetical protein
LITLASSVVLSDCFWGSNAVLDEQLDKDTQHLIMCDCDDFKIVGQIVEDTMRRRKCTCLLWGTFDELWNLQSSLVKFKVHHTVKVVFPIR